MPAATRGEKSDALLRERHQVLIRHLRIVKRIAAQHAGNLRRLRIGIQDQIDFRFGLVFIAESVVQQVVENFAVEGGALLVVGGEGIQGRAFRRIGVTHANGQAAQLLIGCRQQVRLQIEHHLQTMFGFAQEGVVFFQDGPFLVRKTAAVFQHGDGFQRVAGAEFGQDRRR